MSITHLLKLLKILINKLKEQDEKAELEALKKGGKKIRIRIIKKYK